MGKATIDGVEFTLKDLAEMDQTFTSKGFGIFISLIAKRMDEDHIETLKSPSSSMDDIRHAQGAIETIEWIPDLHELVLEGIKSLQAEAKEESEED